MSAPFLYEFLYRGRPPSGFGAGSPDWHVVLGQYVTMPGQTEPQFVSSGVLTPEQAEAAGYSLNAVAAGINAAALADRDAMGTTLAEAKAEAAMARDESSAARSDLEAAQRALADAQQQIAALSASLAASPVEAAQPTA